MQQRYVHCTKEGSSTWILTEAQKYGAALLSLPEEEKGTGSVEKRLAWTEKWEIRKSCGRRRRTRKKILQPPPHISVL